MLEQKKSKKKRATKKAKPTAETKVSLPAADAESEHEDTVQAKKKPWRKRTKNTKPTAEPKVSPPAADAESEHEDTVQAKKKPKRRKTNDAKPTAEPKISIPAADAESEHEKRRSKLVAADDVVLAGLFAPPLRGEVLPDSLPLAPKTKECIGVVSVRALASWEAFTGLAGGLHVAKVVKVGCQAGKHPELSALSVVVQADNVVLSCGPRETKAQGLLPTRSGNGADWALLTRAPEPGRGSSRGGRRTK